MNVNLRARNNLSTACFAVLTLFYASVSSFSAMTNDAYVVHENDALKAANGWIRRNIVFKNAARILPGGAGFRIDTITPLRLSPDTGIAAYHVALLPRGYLIVSADKRLTPVQCFSTTSELVLNGDHNNALRTMLMSDMAVSADALKAAGASSTTQADAAQNPVFAANVGRWKLLDDPSATRLLTDATPSNILVSPLIETHWSQWRHFNAEYPDDPQPGYGYDGKAPAGCVPVAGAQLARFYSWPPYGQGGNVDIDNNSSNLISGTFESDFRGAFQWTNMLMVYDPYSEEPSNAVRAVSELIYGIGVAVDIDFGSYTSQGSVAVLDDLGSALNKYFYYESGTLTNRSGDEDAFDNALRDEILASRPVSAGIPGHAVMIDGYAEDAGGDYFHINYGWGGQNDGWYHLSDVNGSSLRDAILGLVPQPIPLLGPSANMTNVNGHISLSWYFPEYHLPSITGYTLYEGLLHATNSADNADDFTSWAGDNPPWTVVSGGTPGNCFRKTGQQGCYRLDLRDFVKPGDNALLQFDYKSHLIDDHFYMKTSIDGGFSWTVEEHFTNTGWDTSWHQASVDLSVYSGHEVLIRFEYSFSSGSYWSTGGVWLDNITMDNVEIPAWNMVEDAIPPGTTNTTVNNRFDGCHYYSMEADNGVEPLGSSPYRKIIVVLAPELDMDNDGIANGWESQYFGSPTGAVAQADGDLDGFSNLSEYVAGTDPTNNASCLMMRAMEPDPAGIAISWSSVSNRTYALWFSTNLTNETSYTSVTSGIPADPPMNRFVDEDTTGLSRGFYKIGVTGP